jgi:hypothetical protein
MEGGKPCEACDHVGMKVGEEVAKEAVKIISGYDR